jgi:hypothetical protein
MGHFFWQKCLALSIALVNSCMEPNTEVTLQDLDEIRTIIDVAAKRGAFHANEMSQVGRVYDKLSTFLDTFTAQANADQQQIKGESQ